MIIVRNKYTGREYAYPESRFSDMPAVAIDNGAPGHTSFSRHDLISMVKYGNAKEVGQATLALTITYDE